MARTRVVLAAMPKMLGEIVRETLATRPDLEIAAELHSAAELAEALASTRATLAIIGLRTDESPMVFSSLLLAHPELKVVAITSDGRAAYLCELRLEMSIITELSPQGLLAALSAWDDRKDVDRDLHLF